MSTKTATVNSLSLVCLPTTDQDKSIAFYVEKLGFEKRTDEPFGGKYRWVEVYPPNGNAGIALPSPPPGETTVEPTDTGIVLTTDDIDALHKQFQAERIDVDAEVSRMGDPVPPMFWFRDPQGYKLMVVETPKH
ncbi:MAG: VOC family protein [Solirubrobacterales bacterium]|nr:VOC family protein [Solirubrobacterales bacterium]